MNAVMIFVYLGLFFAVLYVYFTIRIISELKKRDVHINFILLRILIIKYINQYKKITTQEKGEPGEFYRPWLLSIIATGACFAIAILVKILSEGGLR